MNTGVVPLHMGVIFNMNYVFLSEMMGVVPLHMGVIFNMNYVFLSEMMGVVPLHMGVIFNGGYRIRISWRGVVPLHMGVIFNRVAPKKDIHNGVVPLHMGVIFNEGGMSRWPGGGCSPPSYGGHLQQLTDNAIIHKENPDLCNKKKHVSSSSLTALSGVFFSLFWSIFLLFLFNFIKAF